MVEGMGLEVIGVGWCRTGTSSLKVALDTLGFGPCFHGRFIPYLPNFRRHCYAYAVRKQKDFPVQDLFATYRAAVDIPAGLIPLVLDAFPNAKVRIQKPCNRSLLSDHLEDILTYKSTYLQNIATHWVCRPAS
jgi:hypothetical protein